LTDEKPHIVESDGLKKETKGGSKKYAYSESYSWRQFLTQEQIDVATKATSNKIKSFFNNLIIREFAEQLGGDSLECYNFMYDIRYLSNQEVLNHYNKLYTLYKTVPIVFLSIVKTKEKKIKAIHLWQFNESCPVNRNTSNMETDCPPHKQILVPHNSILLLAKFVTSDQEELLDGQFLSDSRVLIKSRLSGSHLRFREYDMMDLRELVKINPYDAKIDNRFYCASKLEISLEEGDGVSCDLSRIRRLMEIDLLEYYSAHKKEGVQSLPMFLNTESHKINGIPELSSSSFSEIYSTRTSSYAVLVDRSLSKMILFKKDSLKVIDLSIVGQISLIYENNDDVFSFLNTEGKVFRLALPSETCEYLMEIKVESQDNIQFLNDSIVYLAGTKFYSIALKKGAVPEYFFDVEEVETGEEDQEQFNRVFIWEAVQDKIVFIKGIFMRFYDMTLRTFEGRQFDNIELMEYQSKNIEWRFSSKQSKLFLIRRIQEMLKIQTFTFKSKVKEQEAQVQIEEDSDEDSEDDKVELKDESKEVQFWVGDLRKNGNPFFAQATGPNDQIIFLRLEDPYLRDDYHRVSDIPNYLFSSFVFPPKKEKQSVVWEDYYKRQEKERVEKRREEYRKKLVEDAKEFEEYEEMKIKVNKHLKEAKVAKNKEKYQEERKEKMADLRKAIVRSGKEEGADRADKRLKDVKEDYMSLYQHLKKEKKQQMKEKDRNKNKDRKNDRNNKRGEY